MEQDLTAWVGRTETAHDILDPARSNALCAAVGAPASHPAGAPLPLLHHWLYFWDVRPPLGLGVDGHPARGGFLPPVPLPRRMWAGGRLSFIRPLLLGEAVSRVSTILKVEAKSGRSGNLVFVTVRHELSGPQGVAIEEEQDIVYRDPAPGPAAPPPSADSAIPAAPWRHEIEPDPVLLFRYSALTMNSHRIHYDLPYAQQEEAYPGLVVHGPLQATLLAALGERNLDGPAASFEFRGLSPAFAGATVHVCGEPAEGGLALWTEQGGRKSMTATMTAAA